MQDIHRRGVEEFRKINTSRTGHGRELLQHSSAQDAQRKMPQDNRVRPAQVKLETFGKTHRSAEHKVQGQIAGREHGYSLKPAGPK